MSPHAPPTAAPRWAVEPTDWFGSGRTSEPPRTPWPYSHSHKVCDTCVYLAWQKE
jgi:hypothetical protein